MSDTVMVTGAASGLGAAVRTRLEADGYAVIGVDVQDTEVIADLGTVDGRKSAVREVVVRAPALRGAVLAAGIGPHVADTAQIVSVNYFGVTDTLTGLLEAGALARADAAAVVVSSNSATIDPTVDVHLLEACLRGDERRAREIAAADHGHSVYASSKRALMRMVRECAAKGAPPRLNAVAPGPFASRLLEATRSDPELGPMLDALPVPLGRIGDGAEIAEPIVFLLSHGATYVHGGVLFVDGGTDALIRPDGG